MFVLGIAGRMGTGKTTLAREIQTHLVYSVPEEIHKNSYVVTILSFADCLKKNLIRSLDIDSDLMYTQKGKHEYIPSEKIEKINNLLGVSLPISSKSITYRELMQQYGALVRQLDEDIWVTTLRGKIAALRAITPTKKQVVIIDDIRYHNEASIVNYLIHLIPYEGYVVKSNHLSEACFELTPITGKSVEHICIKYGLPHIKELAHKIVVDTLSKVMQK